MCVLYTKEMGNPWMDFLAEERGKDENKDVAPMELSSHVRPKYDAWKAEHGIVSAEVAKAKPSKGKTFKKKMNKRKKTMKKMYAKGKGKAKANAYMMPMQGGQEGHEQQQQEGPDQQQQEGPEQRGGRSKKGNKKK
jgi:hypothetical protein